MVIFESKKAEKIIFEMNNLEVSMFLEKSQSEKTLKASI